MATVCLHPRKYLRYLGWCILGVVGELLDDEKNKIALEGELLDRDAYEYRIPDRDILARLQCYAFGTRSFFACGPAG